MASKIILNTEQDGIKSGVSKTIYPLIEQSFSIN